MGRGAHGANCTGPQASTAAKLRGYSRGGPMIRIASYGLIALVLTLFAASYAIAQQCQFNGDCPMPQTCQPGLFGGHCDIQACNADTDCRNGSACALGICQSVCVRTSDCPTGQACVNLEGRRVCVIAQQPAPSGAGGGPTRYYIEGGACGIIRFGHVTKHLGCAPGLLCSNPNGRGVCVRPPA
jgi:hypothetical protein